MFPKNESVSSLFNQYQQGRLCKKGLEALLAEKILAHPVFYTGCYDYHGDFADFIAWFYPRLSNAIDRYEYLSATFATYLRTAVRQAFREFHIRENEHKVTEQTVWREKALESMAEPEPVYTPNEDELPSAYPPVSNRRQVLVLLLKSYYFVTPLFIERAAPAIGMDAAALTVMVNKLREMRKGHEQKVHDLQERVHAQYYRCLTFRRRADTAAVGSGRQQHWQGCYERGRKRLKAMRASLRNIGFSAKNREVAQVLGLTKGAVDATLYFARKRYGLLGD